MFLTSEIAKIKANTIIFDDNDNDIVFVVAHKGIGKTKLLEEIYGSVAFNRHLIVADGKTIKTNASNIKRCFAEGIIEFILQHNSVKNRRKLCNNLGNLISPSQAVITTARRKLNVRLISTLLCSLPLCKLKETYYDLAEGNPLVIVSSAMSLTDEEIHYLKDLPIDPLGSIGARVTFVIGIRATPQNLTIMDEILKSKSDGIWIIPLLPTIEAKSISEDPRSISSISVGNSGTISNVQQLQSKIFSNSVYIETYEIVRHLSDTLCDPHILFVLANQEVSLNNYEYICDITKLIYKRSLPSYDSRLLLPNNGKLLWLDALSYYLALQKGLDEAISDTQRFFLGVIREIATSNNKICFGKPSRNAFSAFIKGASSLKDNALANGFTRYYSDFAALARVLFLKNVHKRKHSYHDSLIAVEVLDRVVLDFSNDNIEALKIIYESTQICFVLDIGLSSIKTFIQNPIRNNCVPEKTKTCIEEFLRLCMFEAYKWNDVTLIQSIAEIGLLANDQELKIRVAFREITNGQSLVEMYPFFIKELEKYGIKPGGLIMPKNTIFLSYTQINKEIADGIDYELQKLGYEVKRDIRNVETWGNLKAYMKTVRKEDYAIFLVSDAYLRRDNCLFEVMEFLKDDSYVKRAFPIAINFSHEEKKQRSDAGLVTSMFAPEYTTEIVSFWEERKKKLAKMVNKLSPENRGGLGEKCRDIANMAQSAEIFLTRFFGEMRLMTIDPDTQEYDLIALEVDKKAQERLTAE